MDVIISLASPELKQSALQRVTRDLCASLQKSSEVEANILEKEGGAGTKGEAITLGTIALSLIGGGGVVVTLLNIFKSYVDRVPSMEVSLEKDGKKIAFKANNLEGEALEDTIKRVKDLFGDM